ncbi:MAG: tripartite tricarboxylate transporter TctB family protein [Oscillospiraceae bacterium]|nr:tripartite tricarboxylate transporter TctB family protein [Oscillospiraceae bacterium]
MRDYLKNKNVQESIVVFLLGLALGAYSLISFHTARVQTRWIMSPYLFPLLLSVFAVLLSVSLFGEGRFEVGEARRGAEQTKPAKLKLKNVLVVVLMGVAYYVLISLIHFIPASMVFLAAMIWFLGERRWWMIALVAVLMPLVLYALFALGLSVRLP